MPMFQSTANQKMIVTHCATLHHPHHSHTRHLQKTDTHQHLKHIHLICLLERNSENCLPHSKKPKLIENRRFFCQMKCDSALRQTKTTNQTNAYATQLFPNANPMERDQHTFGIMQTRHDFTNCFSNLTCRIVRIITRLLQRMSCSPLDTGVDPREHHTRQHHPCPSPT